MFATNNVLLRTYTGCATLQNVQEQGGNVQEHGVRKMTELAPSDLRLVSVWHGDEGDRTLHFSLYNTGSIPVEVATLHVTGGFWLLPSAVVRGASLDRALSNHTAVCPESPTTLDRGEVWTFSIGDANIHPHRAGDGPQSAYVVDRTGKLHLVAVQPLARSLDTRSLDGASPPKGAATAVAAPNLPTLSVIPFPNLATVSVAPLADLGPVFAVDPAGLVWDGLVAEVNRLAKSFGQGDTPVFAAPGAAPRTLSIRNSDDPRLGAEGYRLVCDGDAYALLTNSPAGVRHGLVTLAQMVVGARADARLFGLPVAGTITDVPRFGWRGLHLDVARTFYPVEEIMALADLAAWLKLNILHLHLNDDEGWRIAVDGYPEIAEIAAWRGHGLPVPPLLGSGPAPYGGIYSADDIARLTAHCTALGISILPEIDIPGHGHAALSARPDLREAGDISGYRSVQGFERNALNPMQPGIQDFVAAALRSTLQLFDGPAIHIGGDEVAAETWSGSPIARAAAGGRATGTLQSRLINPAHDLVTRAGRKTVVWEDAVHHSDLNPDRTVAIVWQHPDRAHDLAARGYQVVLSPGNAYYLDMAHSDAWDSIGGHWAGTVPLERTYGFEPGHNWPADRLAQLLGVHACIWGESMQDRRNFDDLVFPRIYAYAERAWIDPDNRDLDGLKKRLPAFPQGLRRAWKVD